MLGRGSTAVPGEAMADDPIYHDGMRRLQDARETRRIADRLEKVTVRTVFTDEDRAFIDRCTKYFVETAASSGHTECTYKGGLPGFVRFRDVFTLAVPDYVGFGMYRSRVNILVNPLILLLFLDFEIAMRI